MTKKKVFCLLMTLCLVSALLPTAALAAPDDGICPHHLAHDAACGYEAAKAEVACDHVCSAAYGCTAAVPEVPCNHVHDSSCGYVAPITGVLCNHSCDIDEGCQNMGYCTHVHNAECGYVEAVTGSPCTHTHATGVCSYAAAVPAACAHTAHDATCSYSAAVSEVPCAYASGCTDCDPFQKAVITVASAGDYDGTAKTPTVTVTIDGVALVNGTDYTVGYSNNINAGVDTAVVTITGINTYDGQTASKKFSIGRAALTITATSCDKTYGEADPTLTYNVTGLVNGDTADAVLSGSLARTPGENAGDYIINGGTLNITNTNYGIKSFVTGKLTINPKAITVTAGDQSIVYGATLDNTKVAANALVTGDTLASATLTPSTTDVTTEGTITPKDAVIKNAAGANVAGNYEITYAPGKLTITPKTVTPTIEISPNRYAYNNGVAITPTKVTVKDGDKVIPASEYTLSYANNVAIGTATVSVTDKTGGNYVINPASAPFSIVQSQSYAVLLGNGQNYVRSSYYGLSFATNAPAENFVGLIIDNQAVSNSYYTSAANAYGTVVNLNPALMNLIANGSHTIVFKYSDGAAAGTFTIGASSVNGVQTGDESDIARLSALVFMGLLGSALILPALRKQRG